MKLRECLELARECGLTDVGEAYLNIRHHAMQIFKYDEIVDEVNEITREYNELYNKGLINADMQIKDALQIECLL